MNEADLKHCIDDYLTYSMNQGRFYFDRLNSGEVIIIAGKTRRRIKLCREGTADFFVLQSGKVTYLECKSETGKQSPAQKAFQILVEEQKARSVIVRNVGAVMGVFGN